MGDQHDEKAPVEGEPEDALRDELKVDPDSPPARRNEEEPVVEPEPLKDQGDPLSE
jgi:hypothetical protein